MRTNEIAAQAKRKAPSPGRVRALVFTLAALIIAALACSCFQFARSYNSLREAIQIERMDYVQEISEQIITCQQFMKDEYSDAIINYAGIINRTEIASLADAHECISSKDAEDILLVSDRGEVYDLGGNAIYLPDRQLIQNLPQGEEVVELFCSLNYTDDHWLFAARIDPLLCEGVTYTTVVLSVSADEFRESLAISLFDGRGASYIIQNDGSIEIMADTNLAFDGYNLLSSMLSAGANQDDVIMLEDDMWGSTEGSFLFKIGDQDWLISHSAIDSGSSIIVTVPLAITAAQTYESLSSTILFAATTVLTIAALAVLFILFFFYRDRQHSREAMAVAAKSDFFSKMSHDIRTPLNAIVGLELLAKDCTENPQAKEYLDQSSSAASYLLSIINDVLDMSRIESGKIDIANLPFDMNELVTEVKSLAATMATERNLCFETEVDSRFETKYLGDAVRVKQVLMNLLSNATKFTKEGGAVKLKISHEAGKDELDIVTIVISDTGIGMSKKFLSRIFKPFEQEHSSYTQQFFGSGLGLSIVHNLVTMMNGSISVDSTEGVGSTFTVQLPFVRGAGSDSVEPITDASSVSFVGRTILLAEDNAINQQIAVALLRKKFDVSVETAGNGREAVDMFAASEKGRYSLILMDVKMPVMDGLEAARQIRKLSHPDAKSIPIVALSANAFEEDVALSLAAGMNDHLSKPIDINALGKVLNTYYKEDLS